MRVPRRRAPRIRRGTDARPLRTWPTLRTRPLADLRLKHAVQFGQVYSSLQLASPLQSLGERAQKLRVDVRGTIRISPGNYRVRRASRARAPPRWHIDKPEGREAT